MRHSVRVLLVETHGIETNLLKLGAEKETLDPKDPSNFKYRALIELNEKRLKETREDLKVLETGGMKIATQKQ